MKKLHTILDGFCAIMMQDTHFEAFIEQIKLDIPGNPEISKEQEVLLIDLFNKKPKPEDLTSEVACKIACWINT